VFQQWEKWEMLLISGVSAMGKMRKNVAEGKNEKSIVDQWCFSNGENREKAVEQ
jgi:hypothetical protein